MIEEILGYEVERKKVKNINLRIRSDLSIFISAPINIDKYYIEQFILSKKSWIDKNIAKIKEYRKNIQDETLENGTKLKFLGEYFTIDIIKTTFDKVVITDNKIIINTKSDDFSYKMKLISQFYYKEAEKLFKKRLSMYKLIMNENIERLIIKEIKGKWGYCKPSEKTIALNTKLIKRSLLEIDYVIIHELAHLKHPNHSINFYRHVEKYIKNYKDAEKKLKYK
ncbi:M48 family metallopeptidase [Streptobacillus notomytis]|uniref:M48 family metallopeptidase n=1 Tax=Streptobacillus notomytis TaxID=1712031 RepID=UPI000ABB0CEB|nr:SprT family zinc-dependent metalloprotease [Streptobacillus notomytis]